MDQTNMTGAPGTSLVPPSQEEAAKIAAELKEKEAADKKAKEDAEKEAKAAPKGSKAVVGKVFMSLPNGGELKKGEKSFLSKEDLDHLNKSFGEGVKHILE